MKGWIGVDLDGCLAEYRPGMGANEVGDPVPAMVERVKGWIASGEDVRIFTARVDGNMGDYPRPDGEKDGFWNTVRVEAVIMEWCRKHLGKVLPVTCVKDYGCKVIYDDRCRQVELNTGKVIGEDVAKKTQYASVVAWP